MHDRVLKGVLALALCLPAVAAAQQRGAGVARPTLSPRRDGTWELSVGVGGTYLDQEVIGIVRRTDPSASRVAPGGVLRLGYNLGSSWNLSAGAGVGYTKPALILEPFGAITWTPDINATTSPFLTVGAGITNLTWSNSGSWKATSKYGVHVGIGLRQMLGARFALRLEMREQYEKFDTAAARHGSFEGIGTMGFSWFLGGGPSRDSDRDGVPDRLDRCPRTPAGASVDARGCPLDADGDGVADGLDRCPRTPAGVRVDGTGCPLDSDRDGIADDADRCANTPAGAQVDASGCPVDSDGDGVADSVDQCPDTPANARPVDARGCPADSDRDGVPDYLDRCASTAAGTPVNAAGCPVRAAPQPAPAARAAPVTPGRAPAPPAVYTRIVLRRVNFRPNRAMIPAEAFAELDSLAAAIVAQPGSRWEVAGYTSSMGNAAANLRLSRQRALAVRAYLIGKGVPGSRLVAVGRGSRNPIASNATVAGRRANMRVEIRRLR